MAAVNDESLQVESREHRLRSACAELDLRLRAGESVHAEDYLAELLDLADSRSDVECVLELVYTEYLVREVRGEQLPREAWYQRFPQWRDDVRRLFEVHELARQSVGPDADLSVVQTGPPFPSTLSSLIGKQVGQYELLEEIGRGGMGVVFKARQLGLDRTVAIKMILSERETWQMQIRFRKEAETVARLRHPNIVQVFEVGQQGGCSYLSMEFIDGKSLDRQLVHTTLPVQRAAMLVESLALAMHYAHSLGIIHRDLKPANILLTADGNPKITDFGLAKLRAPLSTNEKGRSTLDTDAASGLTVTGQILGTPCYMAPEQTGGQGEVVGAAADVYSLGAILYEALCGRPPFRGETPWDTLDQVRSHDPVPPRHVRPQVPRDLETICLKCLSKEPRKRYSTAQQLAEDLRRFLNGEPIAARSIRWWERAGKWVRRRPAAAACVLAVWAGLVGVTFQWFRAEANRLNAVRAAQDAVQARNWAISEQQRAELNFEDARKTIERLTQLGQELAQRPHMQKTGHAVLAEALHYYQNLLDRKGSDPIIQFETSGAAMCAAAIQAQLGQHVESEKSHRRAIDLLAPLAREYPEREQFLYRLASAQLGLAHALRDSNRAKQAEEMYSEMIEQMNQLIGKSPDKADYRLLLAVGLLNRCAVLSSQDWDVQWETDLDRAITLQQSVLDSVPGQLSARGDLAMSFECLGDLMVRKKQTDRAEVLLRQSLRIRQQLVREIKEPGWHHHYLARGRNKLAHLLSNRARFQDAQEQFEESIRISEPLFTGFPHFAAYSDTLVASHAGLADIMQATDRASEAVANYERCVSVYDRLASDFPAEPEYRRQKAAYLLKLGILYKRMQRSADAEKTYREAIGILDRLTSRFPDEPAYQRDQATVVWYLACLLRDMTRLAEAEEAHRQALRIREILATKTPDDPGSRAKLAQSQRSLGTLLQSRGKAADAIEVLSQAIENYNTLVEGFSNRPTYQKDLADTYDRLAQTYKRDGNEQKAVQAYRKALEYGSEKSANNFAWFVLTCADERLRDTQESLSLAKRGVNRAPRDPDFRSTLGLAYFRNRDWRAALDELQQAIGLRTEPHGAECILLAMTHWHLGNREEAQQWYQRGLAWLPANQNDVDYADVARLRVEAEVLMLQEK